MSRQVRMARSVGRPSRRKKLPGMRPAAYMRSSTSTVRGKKSMPSRIEWAALAVTSTSVRPRRATTAPWLWNASLPVSKLRVVSVPDNGVDTAMGSAIVALLFPAVPPPDRAAGPVPSRRSPGVASGLGDWQLTVTLPVVWCQYATERPRRAALWRFRLAAKTVAGDDRPVAFDVVRPYVVEQPSPAPHQHQQAAPAVMVLLVLRQVVVEVVDARGEQRDLGRGRPGVGVMELVVGDDPCVRRVDLVRHACSFVRVTA